LINWTCGTLRNTSCPRGPFCWRGSCGPTIARGPYLLYLLGLPDYLYPRRLAIAGAVPLRDGPFVVETIHRVIAGLVVVPLSADHTSRVLTILFTRDVPLRDGTVLYWDPLSVIPFIGILPLALLRPCRGTTLWTEVRLAYYTRRSDWSHLSLVSVPIGTLITEVRLVALLRSILVAAVPWHDLCKYYFLGSIDELTLFTRCLRYYMLHHGRRIGHVFIGIVV
jgi:hypothetical protein